MPSVAPVVAHGGGIGAAGNLRALLAQLAALTPEARRTLAALLTPPVPAPAARPVLDDSTAIDRHASSGED